MVFFHINKIFLNHKYGRGSGVFFLVFFSINSSNDDDDDDDGHDHTDWFSMMIEEPDSYYKYLILQILFW